MHQIGTKRIQDEARLGVKGDSLCKGVKFNHPIKCFMPKPESIVQNKTHKILWDLEIKTHYLISARRP